MDWKNLKNPIFALAPMGNVADTVFRQVVAHCSKPDIFYTEFTNVEGLFSEGKNTVKERLQFTEAERPIIAQVWGRTPENYLKAAKMIQELKFDGIDINMGCPSRNVIKSGSCSFLIKDLKLAEEIIKAVKEGAGDLPVSVKTRIGFDKVMTEEWIGFLLKQGLDEITVHGRTAKQKPGTPADWNEIAKVVKMRDEMGLDTVILGNGDVKNLKDAKDRVKKYKVDGVMIGRAAVNNPWIFNEKMPENGATKEQRIETLKLHCELFIKTYGDTRKAETIKKFVKAYISGFDGAKEIRENLMMCLNIEELLNQISTL